MINGASVVAQSVVALLCTAVLTSIIYLPAYATHTHKHTQARSVPWKYRNAQGAEGSLAGDVPVGLMPSFLLFFGQA